MSDTEEEGESDHMRQAGRKKTHEIMKGLIDDTGKIAEADVYSKRQKKH